MSVTFIASSAKEGNISIPNQDTMSGLEETMFTSKPKMVHQSVDFIIPEGIHAIESGKGSGSPTPEPLPNGSPNF
jgi:hypothetical protein